MHGALAWLRAQRIGGFPLADLVLAALLSVIAVVSVLTGRPDEGPVLVTLPVALAMTGSVAWRGRAPLVSAVVVVVASLVQTLLSQSPGSLWSLVVLIIVMYSVAARYTEGRAALIGLGLLVVLLAEERIDSGVDYVFIAVLFGGTWLLGRASRLWQRRIRTVERGQAELAALAVAEERLRIARELHDTLAHSLSVITVQAEAAAAALDHDPRLAHGPVDTIAASARRSLREVRDVVHQLRDDTPGSRDPLVGLDRLSELVATAGHAGVRVVTDVAVAEASLPPAIDRAAYRIVQEALTNVAKHAPGAVARVRVERADGELIIEVTNDTGPGARRGSGSGVGLVGMAERVHLVGGRLTTGADGDTFRVLARLPLAEG